MKLNGPGALPLLREVGSVEDMEGVPVRFNGPAASPTRAHFWGCEWNNPLNWGFILSSGCALNSLMILLKMLSFLPLSDNKRAAAMSARSSLSLDLFNGPVNV